MLKQVLGRFRISGYYFSWNWSQGHRTGNWCGEQFGRLPRRRWNPRVRRHALELLIFFSYSYPLLLGDSIGPTDLTLGTLDPDEATAIPTSKHALPVPASIDVYAYVHWNGCPYSQLQTRSSRNAPSLHMRSPSPLNPPIKRASSTANSLSVVRIPPSSPAP